MKPTVAVVGASKDRAKYGNKAVRAYLQQGYDVYPVHPKEAEIEGLKVYRSVKDVPVALDRITVYLPPPVAIQILPDLAAKGAKELFINPGSESDELVEKARALGLKPLLACSLVAVGVSPDSI